MGYLQTDSNDDSDFFVVKVQIPVFSVDPNPAALVYNEDRSVEFTMPISEDLKTAMGDGYKKYFLADIEGSRCNVYLKNEVSSQFW